MNTKRIKLVSAIGFIALLIYGVNNISAQEPATAATPPPAVNAALALVQSVFSDATSVDTDNTAFWHAIKNAKGKTLGYVISSRPFTKDIIGYRGATPLVLILDKKKHIKSLRLMENEETPRFIKKLTDHGFLDSWNGKTLKEASSSQVDAVSGATMSSTAIKKNVSILADKALQSKQP